MDDVQRNAPVEIPALHGDGEHKAAHKQVDDGIGVRCSSSFMGEMPSMGSNTSGNNAVAGIGSAP
ncbi:hypothetical protein [Verrucomicrobium spinosum]|uniref:hypothetical protein n=1 Tax=Verrucomicrobium spinosum TaxID=2736 RepID=UPI00210DD997|nr:hypothetical protein [Verrucomicrobium spinosum]